jgi:hypothetical protein
LSFLSIQECPSTTTHSFVWSLVTTEHMNFFGINYIYRAKLCLLISVLYHHNQSRCTCLQLLSSQGVTPTQFRRESRRPNKINTMHVGSFIFVVRSLFRKTVVGVHIIIHFKNFLSMLLIINFGRGDLMSRLPKSLVRDLRSYTTWTQRTEAKDRARADENVLPGPFQLSQLASGRRLCRDREELSLRWLSRRADGRPQDRPCTREFFTQLSCPCHALPIRPAGWLLIHI